jgi:hypothetical protein
MVVPLTDARNCCCWPTGTVTCAGDTLTVTSEVEPRIAEALADAVRSASEVAVTVTTFDVGVVAGATYSPALLIWPHVLPLQDGPARLQITTLFEVPLTTAVNCALPPGFTCTVLGVSETDTDAQVAAGLTPAKNRRHATFKIRLICLTLRSTLPTVSNSILLTSASQSFRVAEQLIANTAPRRHGTT